MRVILEIDHSELPRVTITMTSGIEEVWRVEHSSARNVRELFEELAEEHTELLGEMLSELGYRLLPEETYDDDID